MNKDDPPQYGSEGEQSLPGSDDASREPLLGATSSVSDVVDAEADEHPSLAPTESSLQGVHDRWLATSTSSKNGHVVTGYYPGDSFLWDDLKTPAIAAQPVVKEEELKGAFVSDMTMLERFSKWALGMIRIYEDKWKGRKDPPSKAS